MPRPPASRRTCSAAPACRPTWWRASSRRPEGNPLYVEQMLSMLVESEALRQEGGRWVVAKDHAEITVPPSIKALLEARIGRLRVEERIAIEPASVIGLQFPVPAVASMTPERSRPAVEEHLIALTKKQLVHAVPLPDEDPIYRFHHHLVRDTIYNGLLKRTRATLHVDFVSWADRINAERGRGLEFEEVLGYHLEQAQRYLRELGPLDEKGKDIGRDASRRLASAGRRAFARGDMPAAGNLLRRALATLTDDDPLRLPLLPELGEVLLELGQFAEARALVEQALASADGERERRVKVSAEVVRLLLRRHSGEAADWEKEAAALIDDNPGAGGRGRSRRDRESLARGRARAAEQRAARRGGAKHREGGRARAPRRRPAARRAQRPRPRFERALRAHAGAAGHRAVRGADRGGPRGSAGTEPDRVQDRAAARDERRLRRSARDVPARTRGVARLGPGRAGGVGVVRPGDDRVALRGSRGRRARGATRLRDAREDGGDVLPLDAWRLCSRERCASRVATTRRSRSRGSPRRARRRTTSTRRCCGAASARRSSPVPVRSRRPRRWCARRSTWPSRPRCRTCWRRPGRSSRRCCTCVASDDEARQALDEALRIYDAKGDRMSRSGCARAMLASP